MWLNLTEVPLKNAKAPVPLSLVQFSALTRLISAEISPRKYKAPPLFYAYESLNELSSKVNYILCSAWTKIAPASKLALVFSKELLLITSSWDEVPVVFMKWTTLPRNELIFENLQSSIKTLLLNTSANDLCTSPDTETCRRITYGMSWNVMSCSLTLKRPNLVV